MFEHLRSLENLVTGLTFKEQILIVLFDVSSYILWDILFSAARTSMGALSPLHTALLAENSLTLLALFRMFDYVIANGALEHVFEFCLRIFV